MSEVAEEFAAELLGSRRADTDGFQSRLGITREEWYLQRFSGGALLILVIEAEDVDRVVRELAAAADPFGRWFKQQLTALTGGSFDEAPAPAPRPILSWRAPE